MVKTLKTAIQLATIATITVISTSCASIVNGQNQPISVSTSTVKGATCELENNKGKWYVPSTPGSVTVQRSYKDLHISCQKKGYKKAHRSIESKTKAMAFGNIIFGGVIGAGVDVATGSAYDYPTDITLDMEKGTA